MLVHIIGQVSAGSPAEWIPIEKWRDVRPVGYLQCGERVWGMEVIGKSLVAKHIMPGDTLLFVSGRKAQPGDLCVIQTPHGVTAKYVFPRDGEDEVLLKAGNVLMQDQIWPAAEVTVMGVVIRVERDL